VPLILAGLVYFVMVVWHVGAASVSMRLKETVMPVGKFMQKIEEGGIPRVPGTAVFLTRTQRDAPPVMVWHLKHNRALHHHLFVLSVVTQSVPWVKNADRLTVEEIAPKFWRATARYGFMERPNVPALLRQAHDAEHCMVELTDVTYYVGHETVVRRDEGGGLPRWLEALFALMQRNSVHVSDFFQLPPDAVVEIGRQISI
jgi:KUP system potassium uptake protein